MEEVRNHVTEAMVSNGEVLYVALSRQDVLAGLVVGDPWTAMPLISQDIKSGDLEVNDAFVRPKAVLIVGKEWKWSEFEAWIKPSLTSCSLLPRAPIDIGKKPSA